MTDEIYVCANCGSADGGFTTEQVEENLMADIHQFKGVISADDIIKWAMSIEAIRKHDEEIMCYNCGQWAITNMIGCTERG